MNNRNFGDCDGFDRYSGQRWIYPNNMAVRGYQRSAVELALFNNAMIVLPTGFGKTFIAAVVMYNFYRWYPQGKVVFVAPTKPLVAQQIEECKKISGIPKADCLEVTGMLGVEKRKLLWKEKRVIFATPQVIENDLESQILPSESIKCIVIDEAHRAQGGYSYVNIIRYLHESNQDNFRVLALSATPGSDIQRVQQVMQNLFINEVMFRSEDSIDLMQYRNQKMSKAWTVELDGKHRNLVDRFIKLTDPIYKELHRAGLTYGNNSIDTVPKYCLVKAMQGANTNSIPRTGTSLGRLKFLTAAAMGLSSKYELLTLYGLRVFYSAMTRSMSETKSTVRTCLSANIEYDKIIEEIRAMFGEHVEPDPDKKVEGDKLLKGHPKLVAVKELLMQHFKREDENGSETRAMVFSKYRESVTDIVQALRPYEPFIRPNAFVGQSSGAGTGSGMTQKEQIAMIQRFKAGEFNVLVATCVAEEGLDIGEVDLIICFDSSSSPISTTQRRGRTGRKRSGNVQTICTKGYEEKRLMKASSSRRQVEDQLFKKENYTAYKYRQAPRMVPKDVFPICVEHKIYPVEDEEDEPTPKTKLARKRRTKNNDDKKTACGFVSAKKLCKKIDDDVEASSEALDKAKAKEICDMMEADAFSDEDNDVTLLGEHTTPTTSSASSAKKDSQIVLDDEESWDDLWKLPPNLPDIGGEIK